MLSFTFNQTHLGPPITTLRGLMRAGHVVWRVAMFTNKTQRPIHMETNGMVSYLVSLFYVLMEFLMLILSVFLVLLFCHFGFSKILRCTEVMKSTTSRSSKTHTVHKSHIILVRPLDFVALHSYYGLLFWLFTLTLN